MKVQVTVYLSTNATPRTWDRKVREQLTRVGFTGPFKILWSTPRNHRLMVEKQNVDVTIDIGDVGLPRGLKEVT